MISMIGKMMRQILKIGMKMKKWFDIRKNRQKNLIQVIKKVFKIRLFKLQRMI